MKKRILKSELKKAREELEQTQTSLQERVHQIQQFELELRSVKEDQQTLCEKMQQEKRKVGMLQILLAQVVHNFLA
jgi:hypothetical protein